MGWKKIVREVFDRNPNAVPRELLGDGSHNDSDRWHLVRKNALRNVLIGVATIAVVACAMHKFDLGYELNTWRFDAALAVVSVFFAGVFCLLGESVVEDGVKTGVIAIIGYLLADQFPLPWCLLPGAGATIGTIVNATIQGAVGRHF